MEALMPRGRVRVLRELLLRPERELYLREVAARAGVSLSSAQKELARLTGAGLLRRTQRGRQTFYRAETRSPLYPELRGLLVKTVGLADVLRQALESEKGIRLAFVYGSLAAGEERPDSDVDLLVVGRARPKSLALALSRAEQVIGRAINSVVLTGREFSQRAKGKEPFLSSVLAGPKIVVAGDEDEAARLAG
jgi:predicted nucleotidyltransferase